MRDYWESIFAKIITPVIEGFKKNDFKKTFLQNTEYSLLIENNRNKDWAFMELFARTLVSIAPIEKYLNNAVEMVENVFNPEHSNYIIWIKGSDRKNAHQSMVEGAYLCQSFLISPKLWDNINRKKEVLETLKRISELEPCKNNWILFESLILLFLKKNGIITKKTAKVKDKLNNFEKWYRGDSWYSDGDTFVMNYYNSFVIYPMLYEIYRILGNTKEIEKRIVIHADFLEKLISKNGEFPIFGRSSPYRMAAFNTLALAAYTGIINNHGQIKNGLTKVIKRLFDSNHNFTDLGFLKLGVNGGQKEYANCYTNTGSLYITCIPFMLLGLSEEHPFWKAQLLPNTQEIIFCN
jgi:hypothetical protein